MRFGTDGVRGLANTELTPELALALGRAAARVLGGGRFVVGRDTRRSGPMLEAALAAGLAAEGVDVELLGVIPTPGVAWVSARDGVGGAVISASHNPFADNGIKLFAPGGRKLGEDLEAAIEAHLHPSGDTPGGAVGPTPTGADVGTVVDRHGELHGYVASLVAALEGRRLDGLSVVLDCANGAAAEAAPAAFAALRADVTVLNDRPDGCNINDGVGSTHPAGLQASVVELGADLGLALDGDADRVVAVDPRGRLVDGDHLIAMCALDLRERGQLRGDTVVVTVMTNLGFRLAMADHGVRVVETPVGDRHVLEALDAGGLSLGGEQSGHVIFRELATTGDGTLTGLLVADLVVRSGRPLDELAEAAMTRLPQVLRNVAVPTRGFDAEEALATELAAARARLGDHGRVLVRASGTEPLVRVMVEAPHAEEAELVADGLASAVARLHG